MRLIVPLSVWVENNQQIRATLVFRLQTPATMVPPWANPAITSACPDATPEELSALQAGTWQERVVTDAIIELAATDTDIQLQLTGALQQFQLQLNQGAPLKRYIVASYDGTTWTNWPA